MNSQQSAVIQQATENTISFGNGRLCKFVSQIGIALFLGIVRLISSSRIVLNVGKKFSFYISRVTRNTFPSSLKICLNSNSPLEVGLNFISALF